MNATVFNLLPLARSSAARSSSLPPISPMTTRWVVCGSFSKSSMTSLKVRPSMGSPPMPTIVDWPMPAAVSAEPTSEVSVPLRDDADLRGPWRDEAGTVGSEQSGSRVTAQKVLDPDHVLDRDPLRDTDDELDAVRRRLHDCVRRKRRRHENSRRVGAGRFYSFGDSVEDGHAHVSGPALSGAGAAYDLGPNLLHLLGMERALAPGDALDDDACVRVQQNAHLAGPLRPAGRSREAGTGRFIVNATIFWAASHAGRRRSEEH